MSKHNGNGKPKGVEKYHFDFDTPTELRIGDGISIAASGDGNKPTEVHIYCKVPGTKFASRFAFRDPELLGDFIAQLIAYRRHVFPDAPEIDTNAIEDIK